MKTHTVRPFLSGLLTTVIAGGSLWVASPAWAESVQMAKGESATFEPTLTLQQAHQPDSGMFEIAQPVSRGSDDLGGRGSSNDTATLYNPPGYYVGNQCAANCIIDANFQGPMAWTPDMELRVRTYFPTTVEVYLATHIPLIDQNGDPYFPGESPVATSGGIDVTDWTKRIDLEFGTHYYGIVAATDQLGNTQRKWGEFTTPQPDLRLTFHKIEVAHDGDPGGNAGELGFWFQVDDVLRDELHRDVVANSGETLNLLTDGQTAVVEIPATATLPEVRVAGVEEDPVDTEFCEASAGWAQLPGGWHGQSANCDLQDSYSIAPGGPLASPPPGNLEDLEDETCPELFGANRCRSIWVDNYSSDHPEFTVWYELELIY